MKIKKRYLLASIICSIPLLFNRNNTAMAMSDNEIDTLRQIERDRHDLDDLDELRGLCDSLF